MQWRTDINWNTIYYYVEGKGTDAELLLLQEGLWHDLLSYNDICADSSLQIDVRYILINSHCMRSYLTKYGNTEYNSENKYTSHLSLSLSVSISSEVIAKNAPHCHFITKAKHLVLPYLTHCSSVLNAAWRTNKSGYWTVNSQQLNGLQADNHQAGSFHSSLRLMDTHLIALIFQQIYAAFPSISISIHNWKTNCTVQFSTRASK